MPAILVGGPRAEAAAAALEPQALPLGLPSTSTAVGVVGRGRGSQRTPSDTLKSVNAPNVPKSGASSFGDSIYSALKQMSGLTNLRTVRLTTGSKHTCYRPGCGNSYETGKGDFCPKCGSNQEML